MELTEVIHARTSVRKYKASPSLGDDIIQKLVDLGMRAPSPKNRQPWQVIHVTGREKSDLQAIGAFVEHILLGAKAIGLGTLWMNDVYFMQSESKAFLNTSHDVQAIIAIGIPDEPMYPRPRKSIDEVLVKR